MSIAPVLIKEKRKSRYKQMQLPFINESCILSRLVAGTGCVPDSYTIPTVSSHWIYAGVKQGVKRLLRVGIDI
jgi:hypothetical protein